MENNDDFFETDISNMFILFSKPKAQMPVFLKFENLLEHDESKKK